MDKRIAQGRDIGETFIRKVLALHGIFISPAGSSADKQHKIDGYWNGEPVQLKLRKSSKGSSDDIAFEVVRNHDSRRTVEEQLKNPAQQGRDWKGSAKHYFIMNRNETEINHVLADDIKIAVQMAIEDLNKSPLQGRLIKAVNFSGVDLRPTVDRDPESFTPHKVMAFVPVKMVMLKSYSVQVPLETGPTLPKGISSTMYGYIQDALQGKKVQGAIPNNLKKFKEFEKYAKKQNLEVVVQGGKFVLQHKAA